MADQQNGRHESPKGNHPYYQQPPMYQPPTYQPSAGMEPPAGYQQKSRMAAGLLAFFLGSIGIHCFYLGNTSGGLIRLLISLLTMGIGWIVMWIWGIRDGIKILDGRVNTDAYGFFLKD